MTDWGQRWAYQAMVDRERALAEKAQVAAGFCLGLAFGFDVGSKQWAAAVVMLLATIGWFAVLNLIPERRNRE